MSINRRDFITACGAFAATNSLAKPVRSFLTSQGLIDVEESEDILPASNYIQDGLVALWDGIENLGPGLHSNNTTTWIDHVSGAQVGIENPYPDKVQMAWRDRCFCYDDSYNGLFNPTFAMMRLHLTPELVDIYNNGIGTFEMCCFKGDGAAGKRIYTPVGWYDSSAYINRCPFFTNNLHFNVSSMYNTIGTATVTRNALYLNGIRRRTQSNTVRTHTYQDGDVITFCSRGNYDSSSKRFCCIRFYDRALTDAEIAYNDQIDKERFGL